MRRCGSWAAPVWDDLAIVVRERDASRVEGAELPLEASAARQLVRGREAREGQVGPAYEGHSPSPQVRHGHHERDREVVEPVRLLHVGGKEGCDAFMLVPQPALPSLGARDAEATGPPVGPGVAGGEEGSWDLHPAPVRRPIHPVPRLHLAHQVEVRVRIVLPAGHWSKELGHGSKSYGGG